MNHQRSKSWDKNNKTEGSRNTYEPIGDIKRDPYFVLEECRRKILDELIIDELQYVMVNIVVEPCDSSADSYHLATVKLKELEWILFFWF